MMGVIVAVYTVRARLAVVVLNQGPGERCLVIARVAIGRAALADEEGDGGEGEDDRRRRAVEVQPSGTGRS